MSADHHSSRSSVYYKESYGSSSKRYHSPSESTRLGLSGSSLSHYYESTEGRSKRSRGDTYGNGTGAHTSATSRYNDYSPSGSSNSRYKAASPYYDSTGLKVSSSDYRREDSYGRAGAVSTSSKYLASLEDSYGKLPGSSRSATKSVVRRIPPPLTPPISSSSSKSMMKSSIAAASSSSSSNRLLPLMKVSVASNSGGGTGSSGGSKDYYGSRMRQAPPEHHYPYSSHGGGGSTYKKEFRRPSGFPSFRYGAGNFVRQNSGYGGYSSGGATHGRNLAAIRKLTQRTAASVTSRIQRRATTSGISRSYDDHRRRHPAERKKFDSPKSGSKEKEKEVENEKEKVKENNVETVEEKEKAEGQVDGVVDGEDGNEVIDEVRGDDDVEDKDEKDTHDESDAKTDNTKDEKDESWEAEGTEVNESDEVNTAPSDEPDGSKAEKPKSSTSEKEKERADRRRSNRDGSPSNRTLLKLHCHYCDVRCISFREFSNHLRSYVHTRAMHGAVTDMRKKLSKLRNDQRDDQRKLEKSKSEKTLSDTTSYCRVCELNFRTDPKEHEANELHNKIKTLIYQRCDICNIDFRIWKVYLYHLAALEHAKRVAMKQLHEGEAKGENVKGTNLSQEELGLELVEQRTVFYCNACTRYLPIKGTLDETKSKHCMTLTHLKYVDEYRQREKQIALREKEKAAAKKLEEEAAANNENESVNAADSSNNKESTNDESSEIGTNEEKTENDASNENNANKDEEEAEKMDVDVAVTAVKKEEVDKAVVEQVEPDEYLKNATDVDNGDKGSGEVVEDAVSENKTEEKESTESEVNQGVEEEDEDEIELHAGDEEEDLSMDDSGWSRRTRSSIRKNSSDRKSVE